MIDIKTLTTYGANTISFEVEPSEVYHSGFWPVGGVHPYIGPYTTAYKTINWLVEYKGTREVIENNKSKFLAQLLNDGGITDGDTTYKGQFAAAGISQKLYGFEAVNYQGLVIHLGAVVNIAAFTGTKTIVNAGTAAAGIILEVTGTTGTLTINGELIGTLSPNSTTLVVDTPQGKVTKTGGISGIGLTNIIKLPKLKAGSNTVELSSGITGKITYQNTYL